MLFADVHFFPFLRANPKLQMLAGCSKQPNARLMFALWCPYFLFGETFGRDGVANANRRGTAAFYCQVMSSRE
jgi:hypothetical protein